MRQFVPFENLDRDLDDFVVGYVESVEIRKRSGLEHCVEAGLLIVRHV